VKVTYGHISWLQSESWPSGSSTVPTVSETISEKEAHITRQLLAHMLRLTFSK